MKRKYDVMDSSPAKISTLTDIAEAYKTLAEKFATMPGSMLVTINISSQDESPLDGILVCASTLHDISCKVTRDVAPGNIHPHKLRAVVNGVVFAAYCDDVEAAHHVLMNEKQDEEEEQRRFFCYGKQDFCHYNDSRCSELCPFYNGKGGEYR